MLAATTFRHMQILIQMCFVRLVYPLKSYEHLQASMQLLLWDDVKPIFLRNSYVFPKFK